jgi:hypothetical protein
MLSAAFVQGALRTRGSLIAGTVAGVAVTERFASGGAEVARLALTYSDDATGPRPPTVIAKIGEGASYDDALRELRFFRHLAPLIAEGTAPRLLGAAGAMDQARIVLLLEDLEAAGYARATPPFTPAQLTQVTDALVAWHRPWWGGAWPPEMDFSRPQDTLTRCAQAWPPPVIEANGGVAAQAIGRFLSDHAGELNGDEARLLRRLAQDWAPVFLARAANPAHLTLIHGDFHLIGNLFFPPSPGPLRIIDWSEVKPGLGPHDLAYCLASAPSDDRVARDLELLRRYHAGLGLTDYPWDQCVWDFRFSLLTNLLQSVFQDSPTWLRKGVAGALAHESEALLDAPSGQNH